MQAVRSQIDVRTLRLEADPQRLAQLTGFLSVEERARADRFRFPEHRLRYLVCRGFVRETLAVYTGTAPGKIHFEHNPYGKPSVAGTGLHFNVSHSGDWAMLAVSAGNEVGIDIERIDASFVQEQIPERFFSPREVEQLRSLPRSEQTAAFFRCWTRKEAYIKARGLGLALALDSFDVTLRPDDPPALSRAGHWSIQNLDAPEGYAAAIVAEGGDFTVSLGSAAPGAGAGPGAATAANAPPGR